MNYSELLFTEATATMVTRAALIGVGQFGRTLLAQSRRLPSLELRVLCDLDIQRMVKACLAAGLSEDQFAVVETSAGGQQALESGKIVLAQNADLALSMPVDVVVEATGNPEAAARNCLEAIAQGRHIAMVTKETDAIIGPLLSRRARQAGLVLCQVDGDQPSLLLGLISWARSLGLDITCAGKASEYDFVVDGDNGTIRAEGLDATAAFDPSLWRAGDKSMAELIAHRAEALGTLPQRTPPDFCEMCIVANGSGLKPDRPDMHAAIARPLELPDIYCPATDGGVLAHRGRLDIFNCLRRTDEISFAGGVFAVLDVPDAETGQLFARKGIPVSRNERYVLVYNPTHLLGVEAPLSILVAHRLGLSTGSTRVEPVCDMAMRATADLKAGSWLEDQGYHHRIVGVEPALVDYAKLTDAAPLPYFMGIDRRLTRDVRKGDLIKRHDVEAPTESILWNLRDEQDSLSATADEVDCRP